MVGFGHELNDLFWECSPGGIEFPIQRVIQHRLWGGLKKRTPTLERSS